MIFQNGNLFFEKVTWKTKKQQFSGKKVLHQLGRNANQVMIQLPFSSSLSSKKQQILAK